MVINDFQPLQVFFPLQRKRDLFRDLSAQDPPSPIPNLEVKLDSADGTIAARLWESRPLRGNPFSFCHFLLQSKEHRVLSHAVFFAL